MKKMFKIIMIVLGVIVLLLIVDIGSVYLMKKPVFAIRDKDNNIDEIYYGLLYNTYYCSEDSSLNVKSKYTEFSCPKQFIVGKITDIKNDYIIISGANYNKYLGLNEKAEVSLKNNPSIVESNNLIIGQYIKIIPMSIDKKETISIKTNEILVVIGKKNLFKFATES